MNISHELQDLRRKLESVEQENKLLKLEENEYQKEIADLTHQNKILTDENKFFSESIRVEQEGLSYSRSLSDEIRFINSQNEDLNVQISNFQNITKRLSTTNKTLLTENKRYTILLEQIVADNQQKHKIHANTIEKLENRVIHLENECEALSESANNYILKPLYSQLQMPTYSSFESIKSESVIDCVLRLKAFMTSDYSIQPLHEELHIPSTNVSQNYDDIINQLVQFGYNESDIMAAINSINGTVDINKVVEILDSETNVVSMKTKYNDIEMKLKEIMGTNNELKQVNQKNTKEIKRLQKRIKCLKHTINDLKTGLAKEDDIGCTWSQWFLFTKK